jgi:hypothetical protein
VDDHGWTGCRVAWLEVCSLPGAGSRRSDLGPAWLFHVKHAPPRLARGPPAAPWVDPRVWYVPREPSRNASPGALLRGAPSGYVPWGLVSRETRGYVAVAARLTHHHRCRRHRTIAQPPTRTFHVKQAAAPPPAPPHAPARGRPRRSRFSRGAPPTAKRGACTHARRHGVQTVRRRQWRLLPDGWHHAECEARRRRRGAPPVGPPRSAARVPVLRPHARPPSPCADRTVGASRSRRPPAPAW